jgi:hypothetical protein
MGLDMYAFSVPAAVAGDTQVDVDSQEQATQLAYWRKFNALHGWMEDLYRAKGGTGEFNCNTVRLDLKDLDTLAALLEEHKTTGKALKSVSGFFFGGSEIYPADITDTLTFIERAKQAIADGQVVFYDSWW